MTTIEATAIKYFKCKTCAALPGASCVKFGTKTPIATHLDRLANGVGYLSRDPEIAALNAKVTDLTNQLNTPKHSFADDFTSGTLDSTKWTREGNGSGGYGIENYTQDADLAVIKDGYLHLPVYKDANGWRSACISTRNKFTFTQGTIEIRAKLPAGAGFWPGIWIDNGINGEAGADGSEIDLCECFNGDINGAVWTFHDWHLRSQPGVIHYQAQYPHYPQLTDGQFHTWKMVKQPGRIEGFIDGVSQGVFTPDTYKAASNGGGWKFDDKPFYFIAQVAVMGKDTPWAGVPTPTVSQDEMVIDYITIDKTA